jgi:energy-coupling factor transporter ATP-binding protein EcfA2
MKISSILQIIKYAAQNWGKRFGSIPNRFIIVLLLLLVVLIFDKPILDFFWAREIGFLDAFLRFDYSVKECLIWIFWGVLFITFLKWYFLSPDGKWQYHKGRIWIDIFIILCGIYYFYIREKGFNVGNDLFSFQGFKHHTSIRYLDFVIIPVIFSFINLIWVVISNHCAKRIKNGSKWDNDKPLNPNDQVGFNRGEFVKLVADQINSWCDSDYSFTTGICGPWGSGKTSFLEHLKTILVKNKENLILQFNPWQYPDETNLTRAFLNELEILIQRHSFRTSSNINHYAKQLFSNSGNFSPLANLLFTEKSMEQLRNSLAKSILRSGKRVVIIMDDLDRLQYKEIIEVLTIVRNNGNLPNLLFIVAYDKSYLQNILEKEGNKPPDYLSKFFQAEFELGIFSEDFIADELVRGIYKLFPEIARGFDPSKATGTGMGSLTNVRTMVKSLEGIKLLKTKRDVIRLLNNLTISWPVFRKENSQLNRNFPDFVKLEILRLKYGEVFYKIKNRDIKYIEVQKGALVFKSSSAAEDLHSFVENDNEFKEVNLLLASLFPSEKPEPGPYEIRNPLIFLNYFRNDNYDWELVTTTTTTLLQ